MSGMVTHSTPARIGLLGNPSDGYFGKCISLPVWNWQASVSLAPSENIILPEDKGLKRIMSATLTVFERWFEAPSNGFSATVSTTIPRQVGLAGSSAIETAFFRALCEHNKTQPPQPRELAELVLTVETEELGMTAGLQDRLPQSFEQMLFMDFDRKLMEQRGYGEYSELDAEALPQLWLAHAQIGEDSGKTHSDIAHRWQQQDAEMIAVIGRLADLAAEGKQAIINRLPSRLSVLIDSNFDARRVLFGDPALGETLEMVLLARQLGSCAKQSGSGGAIFGIVPNAEFAAKAAAEFAQRGWQYHHLEVVR